MEKIVLGLSGGVDSAVAASLLRDMGYEVHGLFLDFGLASSDDARIVAENAGIHFHIKYGKQEFEKEVCSYFIDEYLNGRTPNPCIKCNRDIKFKYLIEFADNIGAKKVATGHYAKIGKATDGQPVIMRTDSNKDQTYMMCMIPKEYIPRIMFPLEEFRVKADVRRKAMEFNIPVADKPDSMDACFVPEAGHAYYIEKSGIKPKPGNFVDESGNILGEHKGIHNYTTGQRKGLNISSSSRLFISEINKETNEIILSNIDKSYKEIMISNVNYMIDINCEFSADIKVRYSKHITHGIVTPMKDGYAKIVFENPVFSVSPGQFAVFYDKDILLGGGTIL